MTSTKGPSGPPGGGFAFKRRRIRMLEVEEEGIHWGTVTETENLADLVASAAPWRLLDQGPPATPEQQPSPPPSRPPDQQPALPPSGEQHHRTTGIFFLVLLLMSFAGLGTFLLVHRVPEGASETARSIAGILEGFIAAALVAWHLRK